MGSTLGLFPGLISNEQWKYKERELLNQLKSIGVEQQIHRKISEKRTFARIYKKNPRTITILKT